MRSVLCRAQYALTLGTSLCFQLTLLFPKIMEATVQMHYTTVLRCCEDGERALSFSVHMLMWPPILVLIITVNTKKYRG